MNEVKPERITFSFGRNWEGFLAGATVEHMQAAKSDLLEWLGVETIQGKRILDIGCGSGIHSWAFWNLGADQVISFDNDQHSVAACQLLWEKSGKPDNWEVNQGSILDQNWLTKLQERPFDIVYAWGVLHHTGDLWQAMKNSCSLVAAGGKLWLALYVKGTRYKRDLRLKKRFNRASALYKGFMVWRFQKATLFKWVLFQNWKALKAHFADKQKILARGMNMRHDVIDWLGGLPYEVASAEEVLAFCRGQGFILEKIRTANEGGNNIFLFSRPS
jgi:cyclopropane fatty-acyl-phospholipid synthase-like methyltransferase